MLDRKTDRRPGPLPDIRRIDDSIVYSLEIAGERMALIIRCDADGSVTAQIAACEKQ